MMDMTEPSQESASRGINTIFYRLTVMLIATAREIQAMFLNGLNWNLLKILTSKVCAVGLFESGWT